MIILVASTMWLMGLLAFTALLSAGVRNVPLHIPGGRISAIEAVMDRLNHPLRPQPQASDASNNSIRLPASQPRERVQGMTVKRSKVKAQRLIVVAASGASASFSADAKRAGARDNQPASFATGSSLQNAPSKTSPNTPSTRMVEVQPGVKLEVLDWGGHGRDVVLLAGKGFTAHEFDEYAPRLTTRYHVYGITRRGYGNSSAPPATDENYSADRLGDDVLAVLDQLRLKRPVLVGHSIAGEELSSIGSRVPNKVSGLVYLDAGYPYALYDSTTGYLTVDYNTLRRQLDRFTALAPIKERKQAMGELQESLSRFEKSLGPYRERLAAAPDTTPAPPDTARTHVDLAMFRGEQKFGGVRCPVLAIYADPHSLGEQFKNNPDALKAAQAADHKETSTQADAFQKANPQAVVVRIPNADHFIFRSNEAEVTKMLYEFIRTLP